MGVSDFSAPDPWRVEIIVVRGGSYGAAERRALARDVARGLLLRLRAGAHVEAAAFEALSPEGRHIVRLRAFAAVTDAPPVFSHFSAAVVLGLPVLRTRLGAVHTTVAERRERGQEGVSAHLFPIGDDEIVDRRGLRVTDVTRTVVDIAGAAPFDEGVMAADGALHAGTPRDVLEAGAARVAPRRAERRIGEAVAFAHPGAEGALESRSRVSLMRIGVEPPELQHRLVLSGGRSVFLDFLFRSVLVGGEADGDEKYLSPLLAPRGTAQALLEEKRREDEARAQLRGLARWGWQQGGSPAMLRPVLARVGVLPARPRATLADYCAAARSGRPRSTPLLQP